VPNIDLKINGISSFSNLKESEELKDLDSIRAEQNMRLGVD